MLEDEIHRLQHAGTGAEVFGQHQHLRVAGLGAVGAGKSVEFVQEDARVGQPEPIDGLLHVPHLEQVLAPVSEGVKDDVLDGIGVLVLVHHHFYKGVPPLLGQGGGLSLVIHQGVGGEVLQIVEIQGFSPPFGLLIRLLEGLHHPEQLPHRHAHRPQVAQQGGAVSGEPVGQGRQLLFALLPQGFHPLLQPLVLYLPRGFQLGEGHSGIGGGSVPPLIGSGDELVQPHHSAPKAVPVGALQLWVCGHGFHRPHHLSSPEGGQRSGVLQQQLAPGGLSHIGDACELEHCILFPQPACRIWVALDAAMDVQDHLPQPPVIPSGGHGVHQDGEVPLIQVLVGILQHPLQGQLPQQTRFPIVHEPEVRIQVQLGAALPQEARAEGVDGGDLGAVDEGGLPSQVGVVRLLSQRLLDGGQDFAPQLGRRRLGEGDHQELVYVQPFPQHSV